MKRLSEALSRLAAGLAFCLALGCCVLAALGHGGRVSFRLDLLTHFAPFWLAGAIAAALLILPLMRSRLKTATLLLSALAAVAAGSLIAPEYLRPRTPKAPASAPDQLKLIQFNAWGRVPSELDMAWLVAQDADIMVIEEAEPELRDGLTAMRPYNVTCRACRVTIFSREPPIAKYIEGPRRRGLEAPKVRARFAAPGGAFDVVGVRYSWPTGDKQRTQSVLLARLLEPLPKRRLILSGDFNSTPWSFTRRREDARFGLERRTRAVFSWPAEGVATHGLTSPLPLLPIDHVYAGSDWRTVKVERGPAIGSDHYPLIVTLALEPPR